MPLQIMSLNAEEPTPRDSVLTEELLRLEIDFLSKKVTVLEIENNKMRGIIDDVMTACKTVDAE